MGGKKGGAGENTKKATGNAKKAEAAAAKASVAQAAQDRAEAADWGKGSKDDSKKKAEADKKAEAAAKKEEARRLLEAEEASQPSKPKGANKKTAEKKSRGTLDLSQLDDTPSSNPALKALNATGIDNALDALSLAASSNEIKIDRHPERRKEAAYQAFSAWREEELKGSGLRRDQRIAQMRKEFEKRPENPMNQVGAARYDMSKGEIEAQRKGVMEATENRLT